MAERKITERRTLVSVKSGLGWWGKFRGMDNPVNAVEFMLKNRDNLGQEIAKLETKKERAVLPIEPLGRGVGTITYPKWLSKLDERLEDLKASHKTAQLELAFLSGVSFGFDDDPAFPKGE